jgi:phosphate starvation-inducible protein PhoH
VLSKTPDIAFIYFDSQDVVRHKLVQDIVSAYKVYGEASPPVRRTSGHAPGGRRRPVRGEAPAAE